MEGAVVPEVLFEFAIHRSVPKIFATKVESCQKSRQILHVFTPSEILRGVSPKSYTHFITSASWHIAWKKFCDDTPTSPEVIRTYTLNFRPNLKFSVVNFLKGTPPSQMWCALASLGQSVTRAKIRGGSTLQRPKCSLPQNVRLSWSIWAPITFLFVDQSSRNFFAKRGRGSGW